MSQSPVLRFRIVVLAVMALCVCGCATFHKGRLPGEPAKATFAQVGDTRVHFVDSGPDEREEAVVLIHGFASSMHTWRQIIPTLVDRGHRVIALDLKGFGWTDRPPGDYSPQAQAQLIAGLLEQRGVKRASLVAHSWGSSVALALTLAAPKQVDRIVLYDAWVYEEQLPTFFHMSRADGVGEVLFNAFYTERPEDKIELAFYDPDFITQEMVDGVVEQLERPGTVRAALEAVRGQRYEEVQDKYRTIEQPVLLLWGREDRITELDMGERLLRDLPHAELEVYARCGHFPMYEAAAESTRDLVAFLDKSLEETAPVEAAAPVEPPRPPEEEVEEPQESEEKPEANPNPFEEPGQ